MDEMPKESAREFVMDEMSMESARDLGTVLKLGGGLKG